LLEEIGMKNQRIKMINVSAAMGRKFADEALTFTKEIEQIGPSPLKNGHMSLEKSTLTEGRES